MDSNPAEIMEKALALSESDRAELAHKLLLTLDGEPEEGVEEAWEEEIGRRVRDIEEGKVKGTPIDDVFREMRSLGQ